MVRRIDDKALLFVSMLSTTAVFTVQFTEDDYSYVEGDPNARVCLEGIGEIAQPATATVSSLAQGTATGYTYLGVHMCMLVINSFAS